MTDIKYILGNNPLFPAYKDSIEIYLKKNLSQENDFIHIEKGVYEIGFEGDEFCFDNELKRHSVYLVDFKIATNPVTNGEFLEFINAGGYTDFNYWHSDGWNWVKTKQIDAPLYWHFIDGKWFNYTLAGIAPVEMNEPVCHVSFYEAAAYASWKLECVCQPSLSGKLLRSNSIGEDGGSGPTVLIFLIPDFRKCPVPSANTMVNLW